jgi:hypothetical protein
MKAYLQIRIFQKYLLYAKEIFTSKSGAKTPNFSTRKSWTFNQFIWQDKATGGNLYTNLRTGHKKQRRRYGIYNIKCNLRLQILNGK